MKENNQIAQRIYEALKRAGAGIGNASIPIIEEVLGESSSLPEGEADKLLQEFWDLSVPVNVREQNFWQWHKKLKEYINKKSSQLSSINPSPYVQGKLATGTEIQDDFYPGKQYQNLFDYVANELRVSLLESEMQEIISIVHRDFPSSINPSTEGVSEQDELWEEIVKLVEDRQFREVKYPIVYRELSSKYLLIKK